MNDRQLEVFRLAKEKSIPINRVEGLASKFGAMSLKRMTDGVADYLITLLKKHTQMQIKLLILATENDRHPTEYAEAAQGNEKGDKAKGFVQVHIDVDER